MLLLLFFFLVIFFGMCCMVSLIISTIYIGRLCFILFFIFFERNHVCIDIRGILYTSIQCICCTVGVKNRFVLPFSTVHEQTISLWCHHSTVYMYDVCMYVFVLLLSDTMFLCLLCASFMYQFMCNFIVSHICMKRAQHFALFFFFLFSAQFVTNPELIRFKINVDAGKWKCLLIISMARLTISCFKYLWRLCYNL